MLIYIVYRRWRYLMFLECIYTQYASCYHQSFLSQCLSADILLSVWSFYLITFVTLVGSQIALLIGTLRFYLAAEGVVNPLTPPRTSAIVHDTPPP